MNIIVVSIRMGRGNMATTTHLVKSENNGPDSVYEAIANFFDKDGSWRRECLMGGEDNRLWIQRELRGLADDGEGQDIFINAEDGNILFDSCREEDK